MVPALLLVPFGFINKRLPEKLTPSSPPTSALLDDLNGWLITPSNNFGWIMVGGEGGGFSAHRFSSRENSNTDQRPKLTLVYQSADDLFRDGFEATPDCP